MKKLGEVCEKGSSNISQNQLENDNGDYAIYGASGFIKNVSFYHNEEPYIAIVKDGSGAGRVSKMNGRTSVIGTLQYIYPKEGIDINYLFHFLISIDFKKYITGAAIPHIYFRDYKEEPFLWMPLPEQQRIVAILDEAFAAIEKARANAQQNLKNAKELFESYLQDVFEKKGDGWDTASLGSIANIEYGFTDKASSHGHYRYIRITDIGRNGELILDNKVFINYTKESERFLLGDNDLLMARTGATFAKVLLYKNYEPSVFASYLIRISFKGKIDHELYWYFSKTANYWKQANKLSSGSAQPQFNGAAVKQVVFSYPTSYKEQRKIIDGFTRLSIEAKKLEAIYQDKIADLDELKKSILQKAFAGELSNNIVTVQVSAIPLEKVVGISSTDLQAGITAIAHQKHIEANKANSFRHVKAEKIVHLAEYILNIDLERNPVKDAAGPNDFPHAKKVESRAKKAGYYTVSKDTNGLYQYEAGRQMTGLVQKTETALKERLDDLNCLLDVLIPMNAQQAEILATTYAAWNNLLLENAIFSDEDIVREARENWHEAKMKIPKEKFFNAIEWMRTKQFLVPKGNGKKVMAK